MNEWQIVVSLVASIITTAYLGKCFFSIILKITFKNEDNVSLYRTFKIDKVKYKNKKATRITIGVLGKIINDDGEVLLIKSKRDNQYKPIGGAIKINKDLENDLKKYIGDFNFVTDDKYYAKKNDLRINVENFKRNNKLQKFLFKQKRSYFINELLREMKEEIGDEAIKAINIVDKQPINIRILPKVGFESILRKRDYSQQFIFEIKIINQKILNEIVTKKKHLEWVSLENPKYQKKNIAITSFWLVEKRFKLKKLK